MPTDPQTLGRDLREQKAALVAYLLAKVKMADWHAVQDAASDIREIDAKLQIVEEFLI